jgi:hypothetical protein
VSLNRIIPSWNHHIAYINVPKSACTSIKNIIYFLDFNAIYHDPLAIHHDGEAILCIGSKNRSAFLERVGQKNFVFSFVRHPYKRIYSCYKEKILSNGRWSYPRVRNDFIGQCDVDLSENFLLERDVQEHNFWKFLGFAEATIASNGYHPSQIDHWRSQAEILAAYNSIDFIGRVESFETDINIILEICGVSDKGISKKSWNDGPSIGLPIAEVFSPRVQNRLHKIYGRDLDHFGYDCSI